MKREARDIRERMPKPVRRIPLAEAPARWRIIGTAVLLLIAVLALFFAVRGLTKVDAGWAWIEADGSQENPGEIRLLAELGAGGDSPLTERRFLAKVYSETVEELQNLYSPYEAVAGVNNLWWINHHPNEELQVDSRLYEALQECSSAGRWIFLGPVYEIWDSVYFSTTDQEARLADPRENEEAAAVLQELMALLSPDQISLSFLQNDTIRLNLSPELLAAGEAYDIDRYLDFGWTLNAWIVDGLADALASQGWTRAVVMSPDGFIRCLDDENSFSLDIMADQEGKPTQVAIAEYTGPAALLQLLPSPAGNRARSYLYQDGALRTAWLSPEDGLDRQPLDGWSLLSKEGSCASALMQVLPFLFQDEFHFAELEKLEQENLSALVVDGDHLYQAGEGLRLTR